MNKIIPNLPIAIVFWWVFLLFFCHTDFYKKNYETINSIDVPFIAISLIHCIFKIECYSVKKIIFVLGIFFILQLQLFSSQLKDELYYQIYIIIICLTIIIAFTKESKTH